MDIKTLKDRISIEQIISIMNGFGAEGVPTSDGKALIFPSICHHSESKKLYLYLESKSFYCYSHCHSLDIIGVVKGVLNCDITTSYNFIANKIGFSSGFKVGFDDEETINYSDDWDIINTYYNITKSDKPVELVKRDISILDRFYDLYHINFINDGISKSTMRKYGIKFDIDKNRIIIPHFDTDNNLIAVRCRNLEQELIDNGMKYVPIKVNGKILSAPSSQYLYGLNWNKDNITKAKRIIIFESEKSVMQMDTMFPNDNIAVALSGSALSNKHLEILKELDVDEVVLALDKEYQQINTTEEKLYQLKIKKRIVDKLKPYFQVSIIWDKENLIGYKDSPSDKGREIFLNLFKDRWFI